MTPELELHIKEKIEKNYSFRHSLRRYFSATDSIMERYGTPGFMKNLSAGISLAKATIRMMKILGLQDKDSGEFTDWLNNNSFELDEMLKRFPDPWWKF